MTTDDSKAALAAALHERVCERKYEPPNHEPGHHGYDCDAAAILAAMPDWCGHRKLLFDAEEEITVLRAALDHIAMIGNVVMRDIARAALGPKPDDIHGTPTFSG